MTRADGPAERPLRGVLFDMDGVVTDTAGAHAAAWKQLFDAFLHARAAATGAAFEPFDAERDYRAHVDGKPRHAGVESFLSARGIALPYGEPEDGPDRETICGLAARKNAHFRAWLETHPVRPFPGTLHLLRQLRRAGLGTALFSASRNAPAVLASAGLSELFDVVLDGAELARRGLPGKPDPAMLLETASALGVPPGEAAVIEDAVAGVEAAAAGGFGLIVGVDRHGDGERLRAAGATAVVGDLAELRLTPARALAVKTLAAVPSVWDHLEAIRARLDGRRLLVCLDYDGTLTPIVADHTKALLGEDMRAAVDRLARRCPVAIVSGRDLAMLRRLLPLDHVIFAGSHGFEIAAADGSFGPIERGAEFLPALDAAEEALRAALAGLPGHSVERKRFSIAVHYRQVAPGDEPALRAVVDEVLRAHPRLKRGLGKKVFELQPDLPWNKGEAVLWIAERLGFAAPDAVTVYLGDDITDEHAFRALAGRGLGIVVRSADARPTAADYALADTEEVRRFIDMLDAIAAPDDSGDETRR